MARFEPKDVAGKPVAVAYHYSCPDGVFAALAATIGLTSAAVPAAQITYVPLRVTESEEARIAAIPTRFPAGGHVYLLDFSGGGAFLMALCAHAHAVTLLDHHK